MVIYSMGASVDGFVADREGGFGWPGLTDEQFRFHLDEVRGLGTYLMGRRLYEAMRVWETDPAMRSDPDRTAFADVWDALPKVVFSRTLERVEGNARLAEGTVAEEVAAARDRADGHVSIGGATLAAEAVEHGLVDRFHLFRYPVVVGGGTPYLPPVAETIALDRVETRSFGGPVVLECYENAGARPA